MSYLVNMFTPSMGTRKVCRAPFGGHYLTIEHKVPAMTLEEADIARQWAIHTYGHLPGVSVCLLDAETHGQVDL